MSFLLRLQTSLFWFFIFSAILLDLLTYWLPCGHCVFLRTFLLCRLAIQSPCVTVPYRKTTTTKIQPPFLNDSLFLIETLSPKMSNEFDKIYSLICQRRFHCLIYIVDKVVDYHYIVISVVSCGSAAASCGTTQEVYLFSPHLVPAPQSACFDVIYIHDTL